jgi:asparagine synthase (glutamine-hydrolysing)
MCGIAGIVDLSNRPIVRKKVHTMVEALFRRGPDFNDVCSFPNAVLGHSRLSILDLSSAGNQPMSSNDKRYWIVFNGEIYNHKEIREKLKKNGYYYTSNTDTESLVNGFAQWGVDLFPMCRGMWAFAVWDNLKKTLTLCRDRVGEKPLFYYQKNSKIAFASSLPALKPAMTEFQISNKAISSLMSYQYIPHNESIYEGVKKLPPGHYMTFSKSGVNIKPYWSLNYKNKYDITVDEVKNNTAEILNSAIEEQLEADVSVGAFLSGGIDSGLITAMASNFKPGIISTTMTLPTVNDMDESKNARYIASKFQTKHIEVPLDQNCIKDLPGLLSTIEPFADSSIIPAAAVSKQAAKHMKVVLTGDGGDESFDGYNFGRLGKESENLKDSKLFYFLKMISPVLSYLSKQSLMPIVRLFRLRSSSSNLMATCGINAWLESRDRATMDIRNILYGDELKKVLNAKPGEFLTNSLKEVSYNNWWEGLLGVGFKTTLANDFLMKVDTATMYHSLEARSPFLDHRIIDFATKIPYDKLFCDQYSKSLLRMIAEEKISKEIAYGHKKGFSLPVEDYFLKGWAKLLIDLTKDGLAAQYDLINPNSIPILLNKHGLRSNYKLGKLFFSILSLEIWLRVSHENFNDPQELGERLLFSIK